MIQTTKLLVKLLRIPGALGISERQLPANSATKFAPSTVPSPVAKL